jgi:hypothetical protein
VDFQTRAVKWPVAGLGGGGLEGGGVGGKGWEGAGSEEGEMGGWEDGHCTCVCAYEVEK